MLKDKIKKFKNIFFILISIFVTYSMNMNLDYNTLISSSFRGNSILLVIFFIMTYWLLKKFFEIKNKRLIICCGMLSIIFASFEVVGKSINTYFNLEGILANSTALIKSFIYWLGYAILLLLILGNIFKILEKKKFLNKNVIFFTANIKSFLLVWLIIFISWIPYFLNYFPGITTADSANQIYQSLGFSNLVNHHPILHTLLIGIGMNIGKMIGNYNVGIALYSLCQMLISSAIFSYAIYYMAKREVDIRVRILTLIFYAFYPVNGLYSITMWKDIPFSITMLIYTIMLTEISIDKNYFLQSKLKNVLLVICMILVILFRKNGLFVVLLTIPFLFIFANKYYKKLIAITCILITFYVIWEGPIFSILNVEEGSIREALSIPLQQFARMSKNEDLTEEEKNEIYKFLPVENLGNIYVPTNSDNVKKYFNDDNFKNDKIGFIKLWIKLCIKYPRTALESFLCNSYGYWYPEFQNWVVARSTYVRESENEPNLNLKTSPIIGLDIVEKYDSLIDRRDLPLNSMFYSIGFTFWIVIIMMVYTIYKKEYKLILIYIPIIMLWLTCLASPVSGEYRYMYSMFTCLPLLVGIHFRKKYKYINIKNKKILDLYKKG